MAGKALPPLEGIVVAASGNLLHEIPVAIGAERGPRLLEKALLRGPVRGMANSAVSNEDRVVNVALDEVQFLVGVAPETDLVWPRGQDPGDVGAVGIVA